MSTSRLFRVRLCALVLPLCWLAAPAAAQDKPCAVVLMHGKWGSPESIGVFGRKLEPYCAVRAVEMPWSQRRAYDQAYGDAMVDVQAQVGQLRQQGFQRVLLAGHSFGANAALVYMAEVGDADGVIALAPGHVPRLMYERGISKPAVDEARALVAAGKSNDKVTLTDLNQGRRRTFSVEAKILLSYFEPRGLGNMPDTVPRFKKPVPLLWVIGTSDPLYGEGPAYAFERAPAHTASKYLVVDADHMSAPHVAAAGVLAWIQALP